MTVIFSEGSIGGYWELLFNLQYWFKPNKYHLPRVFGCIKKFYFDQLNSHQPSNVLCCNYDYVICALHYTISQGFIEIA